MTSTKKHRKPALPPAGIPWLPPIPAPPLERQEAAIAAELKRWDK